jgi:hypothetical protein
MQVLVAARVVELDSYALALAPSKVEVAPKKPATPGVGRLDRPSRALITGWAQDTDQPERQVKVDLFDGDLLLATVSANQARDALSDTVKGHGNHGFAYKLSPPLADGDHVIRATLAGTKRELDGSPQKVSFVAGK